jgi:hypothetical protein
VVFFCESMSVADRRFPPPWSVKEQAACFIVRNGNGQQLAYVYFEDEPGQAIRAARLFSSTLKSGWIFGAEK